jgi:hypothetical protein
LPGSSLQDRRVWKMGWNLLFCRQLWVKSTGHSIQKLPLIQSLRTLVAIPISGQLLEVAGPSRLVGFIGGVLGVSIICFCMARWACLEYHWKWICKV